MNRPTQRITLKSYFEKNPQDNKTLQILKFLVLSHWRILKEFLGKESTHGAITFHFTDGKLLRAEVVGSVKNADMDAVELVLTWE